MNETKDEAPSDEQIAQLAAAAATSTVLAEMEADDARRKQERLLKAHAKRMEERKDRNRSTAALAKRRNDLFPVARGSKVIVEPIEETGELIDLAKRADATPDQYLARVVSVGGVARAAASLSPFGNCGVHEGDIVLVKAVHGYEYELCGVKYIAVDAEDIHCFVAEVGDAALIAFKNDGTIPTDQTLVRVP